MRLILKVSMDLNSPSNDSAPESEQGCVLTQRKQSGAFSNLSEYAEKVDLVR